MKTPEAERRDQLVKSSDLPQPKEHDLNEDSDDEKSEQSSLVTIQDEKENSEIDKEKDRDSLFPIFRKTFERKKDGAHRICIRCLKSKSDRCHHCSI